MRNQSRRRRVLIIEDEAPIRDMVRFALESAELQVFEAVDGKEALVKLGDLMPDIILLDWMLPGMSGIDIAKTLRRDPLLKEIPIIMLTARAEEEHRVQGLETGADDYIVKPFSPRELLARIKAVLRRGPIESPDGLVEFKSLIIDVGNHSVSIDGAMVNLGPTEYRLLKFFVTHQRRVYSREQILHYVWGPDVYIEERTVDVHIRRLRKLLAPHGYHKFIQTVRAAGYRFQGIEV